MKKILVLVLAALFLLSFASFLAFAGGTKESGKGGTEKKQETITVLMGIDAAGKHMDERAVEFEQQTGIKVNMVEVSWDTMVNSSQLR